MKVATFFFSVIILISCNLKQPEPTPTPPKLDLKVELEGIEQTRSSFMKAVKEKNWEVLGNLVTKDLMTVAPGSSDWNDMYSSSTIQGPFPYDSIVMYPKETIIVSDSIAYDFGVSKVFYTNKEGKSIELRDTFLAIMKKGEDGKWRLHREVASSRDLPSSN